MLLVWVSGIHNPDFGGEERKLGLGGMAGGEGGKKGGGVLTCANICVYRMELLPKLREQPGWEGEDCGCARQGGMSALVVVVVV